VHPIPSYPSLRSRPSCFRSFTFSRLSIFGIINPRTTKLYRLLKLLSTVGRETRCLSLSLFFNFHTCRQKKARSRHKTELNFVEGSGKQTQPHRHLSIRCSPRTQDCLFLYRVVLSGSVILLGRTGDKKQTTVKRTSPRTEVCSCKKSCTCVSLQCICFQQRLFYLEKRDT
jgi:hypothetical protein